VNGGVNEGMRCHEVWSVSISACFAKLYTGDNFCADLAFTPHRFVRGQMPTLRSGADSDNPTHTQSQRFLTAIDYQTL
jgi:hypothetical protein